MEDGPQEWAAHAVVKGANEMIQRRIIVLALGLIHLLACSSQEMNRIVAALPSSPYVVFLGTAQDGGLPQVGCEGERCRRARSEPEFARMVASLMIVDPRSGKRWLIDATPDFDEQVQLADRIAPQPVRVGRPPLFDGIFLTHAHLGHYTGLASLGREAYGSERTPVWGSERMGEFLSNNGPWKLLVEDEHIELHKIVPGEVIELSPGLSISAFLVPHRDEYTDTLGFRVEGPSRSLIYIPDIDKWSEFETGIESLIMANDLALLDGSFFADGEIPGRAMAEIPHPFMVESLERFAVMEKSERNKIMFTHLNHTNPALDSGSPEAKKVYAVGIGIAIEGQFLEL
ncbi:MAG: pyrroloquinoline quinone biosynthesis protein B [Planctomycetota bacterium]|jgi:pyrroloquinoline quinone biosynthesis protein B